MPSEARIPALDALRTLAILLVINGHVSNAFSLAFGPNRYTRFPITQAGWTGVDLFFVLSGFFIGGQLWKELEKTGTVSVGRFMIRRGLRIWPLYYAMFIVTLIIAPAMVAARHYGWADLVFLTNYVYQSHSVVNGAWSLCSEEQFYLLAPVLLLVIGKRSARTWRLFLIGLLLTETVFRCWKFWSLTGGHLAGNYPDAMQVLYFPLHTHSDGLIFGMLISNLTRYGKRLQGWALGPVSCAVGLAIMAAVLVLKMHVFDYTGLAFLFGGLVLFFVQRPTKLFDNWIFYLLSRLSFGMYLEHEFFEYKVVSFVGSHAFLHLGKAEAAFSVFLLLAITSALAAAITFCLIEHPFLTLRTAILRSKVTQVAPLVAH